MVFPSVSSPSKYFDGRTGDKHAIMPLIVASRSVDVISVGERGISCSVASFDFFFGVLCGSLKSSERLAITFSETYNYVCKS